MFLAVPSVSVWYQTIAAPSSYSRGAAEVLDVFYAIPLKGTKADWLNKQLKPWQGFCRRDKEGREDGATFTDVPGQHYTLMDFDHVPFFQKIFRERLEARGI